MSPPSPSRSSTPRQQAMVVQAATAQRKALLRGLRRRGYRVRAFDEPFAATSHFAHAPADLVLVSLAGLGPSDADLFESLSRRAPATRIWVLVGEGEHEQARVAMRRGAHACLPDPRDAADVAAILKALDTSNPRPGHDVLSVLGPLAGELAHFFGNRLTPLMGIETEVDLPPEVLDRQRSAIEDIKGATRRLSRLQELPPRIAEQVDLLQLVKDALPPLAKKGDFAAVDIRGPARPRPIRANAAAVRLALGAAADALVGLAGRQAPPRLEVRVGRPSLPYEALLSGFPARPDLIQARLRIPGLTLSPPTFQARRRELLWRQDVTGRVHWGLWAPEELARLDGGLLIPRSSPAGGGLAFVFRRV